MNYQDKRAECNNLNQIGTDKSQTLSTINSGTNDLVNAYYEAKNDYINSLHEFNKQLELRESKKRIDKIKYSEKRLHESFGRIQVLRHILVTLERVLNIQPYKSIDEYD